MIKEALPTPQCYCQLNWTSVPITDIGYTLLQETGVKTFIIPKVIPSTAKEILVLAAVFLGSEERQPLANIQVFTQINYVRYEKYLSYFPYPGSSVTFNSENMWFPMPDEGVIGVGIPKAVNNGHGGKKHLSFQRIE
jgi:hypothetical protein